MSQIKAGIWDPVNLCWQIDNSQIGIMYTSSTHLPVIKSIIHSTRYKFCCMLRSRLQGWLSAEFMENVAIYLAISISKNIDAYWRGKNFSNIIQVHDAEWWCYAWCHTWRAIYLSALLQNVKDAITLCQRIHCAHIMRNTHLCDVCDCWSLENWVALNLVVPFCTKIWLWRVNSKSPKKGMRVVNILF